MLKNYLRTAFRNLVKNKIFSTINILGLALGMACSLIIWLWVEDERGVDTFHANDANLYTIFERQYHDGQVDANYSTPGLLPQELKTVFPEVRFASGMPWDEDNTFEANHKILKQLGTYGGPDFFSVFTYPLLLGQPETAVKSSIDIAVSRKMAVSFFGTPEAAMGQTIRFDNKKDLKITAVFEDVGLNSSRKFDYIINWETFFEQHPWAREWGNNAPATHIVLQEGADPKAFENKIKGFLDLYHKDENFVIRLGLQKYSDVYLHSNFKGGEISGGRIQYIRLFTFIAVFVLLIACINFMNLTTARSLKRGKEIGVRKVIGAQRGGLIRQFIGEAFLIVVLAFAISILLVALALPQFNSLTQKEISIPYTRLSFWLVMIILTVTTGFISGSYPALYLSSFNPVKAFKGTLKFSQTARWLRKGLVVFQFTLSIILIVGTIVVSRQVNYIQSVNLGYDRENLISVPLQGDLGTRFELFKKLVVGRAGIQRVSRMSNPPTDIRNGTGGVDWEGKDPNSMIQFTQASVGFDFTETMDIEIIQGRDYSDHYASDSAGYLVNEAALKIIGYQDPIGRPLTFWQKKGAIVGVMKDFHHSSLHHAIAPMILRLEENAPRGWALIRTAPGKTKEALASLEEVYKKLNPQFPFVYTFLDEAYRKLYGSEQIVETLSNTFASLAILISCLGLLGLTMFTAEQRTKEISIRKILGATMTSLFGLLSKELFVLIGISLSIASPLAWYVMKDWLAAYAYHVTLGWWMFLFAGIITALIALATISVQTIRILLINPVNSLRAE
jgi:putative ABC transport system permease protein